MSTCLPCCFTSPLRRVVTSTFSGSMSVTIHGPTGQNVSNDFAARKLHVFALQIARGDIVDAGVAENIAQRIFVC